MKIAIIGAGITGLSAAYELVKKGHDVEIYEQSRTVGGLGTYIKIRNNYLERFYHHFFQSDKHVIALINELGIGHKLKFYPSRTSVYHNNTVHPFTSPLDVLRFSPFSVIDRLRCGLTVAYLKYIMPLNNSSLDRYSAKKWLRKYAGEKVYKTIWEPLLNGKFDTFADQVPTLWLQARLKDRTPLLGYLDGSAKTLFDKLVKTIENRGGKLYINTPVKGVTQKNKKVTVHSSMGKRIYDACVITTVSPIASRLIKNKLGKRITTNLEKEDQLGAVCLILELSHAIQSQYWINICDLNENVLVMVEHTNLVDKRYYGNTHLVYLANYIHRSDKRFAMSEEEVLATYTQILKKLNPSFNKSWIRKHHLSRVPRAQTIFGLRSLSSRPPIVLPTDRIFLANIDQMYPHDRNLNLGVELGTRTAKILQTNIKN